MRRRPMFAFLPVLFLPIILAFGQPQQICMGQEKKETDSGKNTLSQTPWISGTTTRLTFDGRLKHDPVFVDQGGAIVYTSQEKFNLLCLMKLPLDSENQKPRSMPQRFHVSATTSELMVAFASNENHYAYLRNNGNLHFEIVIANQKTGTSVRYDPGGGFAGVRNISFHPEGSNVVFAFPDQNGPQQIKSLSVDGKSVSLLTNSEGINRCPKYSKDGKRIVFSSSRDGDFDVFLMNSDGSHPRNVTNSQGLDTHPVLSPDGSQIAFTALREGNYDIYLIRTDGSQLRRLTRSEEVDDYPCWSPDGSRIIWVGERKGKRDLYSKIVGIRKESEPNNNQ